MAQYVTVQTLEALWSPQEKTMHINCLELLTTDLAMKAFLEEHCRISVLLQLDNSTAVAYTNNLGDRSLALTSLAKFLWLWALEQDIVITTQNILGLSNKVAYLELRLERDLSDCMLAREMFQKINQVFGPWKWNCLLAHQLPRFFSWRPNCLAEAMDEFQQNWKRVKGYANPPWCLIGHILNKIQAQEAQVILVAPV